MELGCPRMDARVFGNTFAMAVLFYCANGWTAVPSITCGGDEQSSPDSVGMIHGKGYIHGEVWYATR